MRGHITKRSKNSWSIVLDVGRDPSTGRRQQRWISVKGTKKIAERRLGELLHQLDTGSFVQPTKTTVGEFLRQWMRDYVTNNVRPRTAEGYKTIVEGQVIPSLGNIVLNQLRPSHLQEYYARTLKTGRRDGKAGGLSARTVLHHHRVLNTALSHAVKWGLVSRNVAQAVDPPRPKTTEMRTLDSDEVHRFLDRAKGTVYHPLFHLDVYTGLRRSELLGLRWKAVDLDMATVSVVQIMHHLRDGRTIFQEPKTAKGRRLVSLPPSAVLALRAHRERQEAERASLGLRFSPEDLVFCHPDGSPFLPDTVTHAFRKIADRVGLRGVRLHDLRHTHASLMLRQNVHPKVVQERLGHATISTTLDIYSHVMPGIQEEAALRFEAGLSQTAIEPEELPTNITR